MEDRKPAPPPEPEPKKDTAREAPALSKNRVRALRERVEELEGAIDDAETAVASLETRMAVPGFYDDPADSSSIVETHQKLKATLEGLYREWESLSEKTTEAVGS